MKLCFVDLFFRFICDKLRYTMSEKNGKKNEKTKEIVKGCKRRARKMRNFDEKINSLIMQIVNNFQKKRDDLRKSQQNKIILTMWTWAFKHICIENIIHKIEKKHVLKSQNTIITIMFITVQMPRQSRNHIGRSTNNNRRMRNARNNATSEERQEQNEVVKRLMNNVIQATILIGKFKNEDVLIPRIPMIPPELPFEFKRLQLPIRLAFAITINKSQGQTLEICGMNLEEPVFTHGQLYVGCSRVGKPTTLYIYSKTNRKTKNIVYAKALE